MKHYCRRCHKVYTEEDLKGLLPICTCGEDLLQTIAKEVSA